MIAEARTKENSMETAAKKRAVNVIDVSGIPCPACGRSDRWEDMRTEEQPHNNPALIISCDCGIGELKIVVE